jgi:hypothetical protein
MGYASFLKPRTEALSGEIEGIIDLANLADSRRKKLEARPEQFFSLTYPTADIRRVIGLLDQRFAGSGTTPGLFLFEGLKGSGKSHLLLLVYHLFKSPQLARKWLDQHGLTCRLPDGIVPVVNKFTDLPLLSVWDFVFKEVTGRPPAKTVLQPSLAEVESALAGRQVVLIFDELEQGIRVLPDKAVRNQNIAFLQMLSEWGNRSTQVTLFASIYSDQEEPGATLKRVPACRVQFAQAQDRARVVLHRIFENLLSFKPESAGPAIESYVNVWRRHAGIDPDKYRQSMFDAYPFSPDLMDIMLRRVPARGGFQNVRGALGFLAHLVRLTYADADLITPGQSSIQDREVAVRLSDLDPGSDLITRAQGNVNDLKEFPFAAEIASATLLYTLTGMGSRTHGVMRDELVRSALRPGATLMISNGACRRSASMPRISTSRRGVTSWIEKRMPTPRSSFTRSKSPTTRRVSPSEPYGGTSCSGSRGRSSGSARKRLGPPLRGWKRIASGGCWPRIALPRRIGWLFITAYQSGIRSSCLSRRTRHSTWTTTRTFLNGRSDAWLPDPSWT